MSVLPYSDLLAQVEALAGATLATAERSRVKIFANRRARKAHRESPYWPHLLHVGEERIVSDTGLLPLAQTGLSTIDQVIRIHAEDPFKSQAVPEYCEYYQDADGIQIAGYQPAESNIISVSGNLMPDGTGPYSLGEIQFVGTDTYFFGGNESFLSVFPYGRIYGSSGSWTFEYFEDLDTYGQWNSSDAVETPTLVQTWVAAFGSGTPEMSFAYSVFVTYIAGIPSTYGDGDGEESDVPEPWFEYMAQGAYADWLRSDGQTEKAMAEEVIAESLLNQQLEKISRSNGNQVVTRMMSHATRQAR